MKNVTTKKTKMPKCSICIATKNKAVPLRRTLRSIVDQRPGFDYEIIVADDGSEDNTKGVCLEFEKETAGVSGPDVGFKYIHLENPRYRNPSVARNATYREAKGEIVIAQSDDVIHHSPDAIKMLVSELQHGEFVIATVVNWDMGTGSPAKFGRLTEYTGLSNPRPLFFLGALWRSDLYAVGGNDEEFVEPCYDDDWFADCLIHGLKLKPRFLTNVVGHHQHHSRPSNLAAMAKISKRLYRRKVADAKAGKIPWCASGGPWKA